MDASCPPATADPCGSLRPRVAVTVRKACSGHEPVLAQVTDPFAAAIAAIKPNLDEQFRLANPSGCMGLRWMRERPIRGGALWKTAMRTCTLPPLVY
jgi:hypothetical protein